MTAPARTVPLERLIDGLARKELELKLAGDYGTVAGIRYSIVFALRLANEGEPPIDPSDEVTP